MNIDYTEYCKNALSYYFEISKKLSSKYFYIGFVFEYYLRLIENDKYSEINDITKALLGDKNALNKMLSANVEPLNIKIDDYFVEPGPNKDQYNAIKMALTNPVSFIQGPPGTGKSRTILNIMSCITNGLGKNVLMVSNNNAAVDVISEKITSYKDSSKINRSNLNKTYAKLGKTSNLKEFSKKDNSFKFNLVSKSKSHDELVVNFGDLKIENSITQSSFTDKYKAITSTIHSMKRFFKDGLNAQYDYVIMDEASQINTMLGLIAASSAKHLIIVGDEQQLAPIVQTDEIIDINNEFKNYTNTDYIIRNDNNGCPPSIIDFSRARFTSDNIKIMLSYHYRCHKGIIEFCNRNIYHDLKWQPVEDGDYKSKSSDYAVPIRIKWFEGNYCENSRVTKGDTEYYFKSKQNLKQITIFIEEELDNLLEKMYNKKDGLERFCILSPFRAQLIRLEDALNKRLDELDLPSRPVVEINKASEEGDEVLQMLSVHKSQGREYDVVYFFPVEDGNWEKPWAQSKSLINVATSRAKKELHIIASTTMMSREMQLALTNRYCPPKNVGIDDKPKTENLRYVQMLIDYTKIANDTPNEYKKSKSIWDKEGIYEDLNLPGKRFDFPKSNCEYGFHETEIRSIFDELPIVRSASPKLCKEKNSPLYLLLKLLLNMKACNNLLIYSQVKLKHLKDLAGNTILEQSRIEELTNEKRKAAGIEEKNYYGDTESERRPVLHYDCIICDRNNKVLLAIEVDGTYHRFIPIDDEVRAEHSNKSAKNPAEAEETLFEYVISKQTDLNLRDKFKIELADNYYKIPVLRLPTDGTCYNEQETIENIIKESLRKDYSGLAYVDTKHYKPVTDLKNML